MACSLFFCFFHFYVLSSVLKLNRNLSYLPVGQPMTPVWLQTVYAFSPTHTHHFQVLIKFLFLNFCGQLLHLLFHFLAVSCCKQNTANMTLTFSPSNSAASSVYTKTSFSGVRSKYTSSSKNLDHLQCKEHDGKDAFH